VVRTPLTGQPGGGALRETAPLRRAAADVAGGPVRLAIRTRATAYDLSVVVSGGATSRRVVVVEEVPAADLTVYPPMGGAFCGVMFGVYALGQGEPVLDPADFSDISIVQNGGDGEP
jgi:hypothetical protein